MDVVFSIQPWMLDDLRVAFDPLTGPVTAFVFGGTALSGPLVNLK